jgi:hypothetical protein
MTDSDIYVETVLRWLELDRTSAEARLLEPGIRVAANMHLGWLEVARMILIRGQHP